MREFNTLGPVYPQYHYHVDRTVVKSALRAQIERGHYMTLNAGRQTGKTTLFQEVITELEQGDTYFGILVSFETLRGYDRTEFYRWLRQKLLDGLDGQVSQEILDWVGEVELNEHNSFGLLLRELKQRVDKRGVLIIDEFDAIKTELAEPMLAVFREMYLARYKPNFNALHSIILVGVRNVPSLLGGTQSPFNVASQFTVPYFNEDEVASLLIQHTEETGQLFEPKVVAGIIRESEGQPFLVNRLAQLLTEDIVPDRESPITVKDLDEALGQLVNEDNTHFFSITSKSIPHRRMLLPILFYDETRANLREAATAELVMYGVLRVIEDAQGRKLARIGNPIYRKILLLTFAPVLEQPTENGSIRHHHLVNGTLNFEGLLDGFKSPE